MALTNKIETRICIKLKSSFWSIICMLLIKKPNFALSFLPLKLVLRKFFYPSITWFGIRIINASMDVGKNVNFKQSMLIRNLFDQMTCNFYTDNWRKFSEQYVSYIQDVDSWLEDSLNNGMLNKDTPVSFLNHKNMNKNKICNTIFPVFNNNIFFF